MRRVSLILIAMACVAAAPAASPWTPRQAACPLRQAPSGLAAEVVKPMLPGAAQDAEISDEAAEQLANLALTCAKQTKVGKARLNAYIEMATWQLTSSGLAPEVSARGIDPATLAAIMNVGAGRANPSFENLGDADVTRMMVALKAKGVNVDALDTDAWHVAGAWLEATSRAYRAGMPGK